MINFNNQSGKMVFIKIVMLPYLFSFIIIGLLTGKPNNYLFQKIVITISIVISIFPYFYWLMSINRLVNLEQHKNNSTKFKIIQIYLLLYIIIGPFFLQTYQGTEVFKIVLIFHFFASFASLYVIWCITKQFCIFENKREVDFIDYVGTFILFSIYPIGIFYIQKRLNRIVIKIK